MSKGSAGRGGLSSTALHLQVFGPQESGDAWTDMAPFRGASACGQSHDRRGANAARNLEMAFRRFRHAQSHETAGLCSQLNRAAILPYHPRMRTCFCRLLFLVLVASLWSGCRRPDTVAADSTPKTNPPPVKAGHPYLDHAQPKLPTVRLWIGRNELSAEVAVTQTEISTGMMFRKEIGDDEGMLFIFARPHQASFYMRNTTVPLSAAYIDPDGKILEIVDLKPLDETPVTAHTDQVQFVLETKQGWFEKNHIEIGTFIRTERGSLKDTFFKRSKGN